MGRHTTFGPLWIAVAAVFAVGSHAAVARADDTLTAKVPFPFIVGKVQLPAGDYIIREMLEDIDVVSIASADGKQVANTLTVPASSLDAPAQPELVFEKFDNTYFLARVVPLDGTEHDIVLTPATMEREIVAIGLHH